MKRDFIVWEKILEGRDGYYVEYCPGRTDYPYASLNIVFPSLRPVEQVADIVESEFKKWARAYNVPLFAAAWDEKEDKISLSSVRPGDFANGYYDPASDKLVLYWDVTEEKVPESLTQADHLKAVYSKLPVKTTSEQCQKNVEEYVRQMRTLKRLVYTWSFIKLFVWPPIKKVVYEITLMGTVARIRAFIKSIREWLILIGKVEPSPKEKAASEKKRQEEHWLYHCKLNPEGFLHLKIANFEQEAKEWIRKEAAALGFIKSEIV